MLEAAHTGQLVAPMYTPVGHSVWFAIGGKGTDLLSSVTVVGTHDPVTLQERIEAFLDSCTTLLADLQAEDFGRHRQALIAAKLQQCHSLLDESDRHWEQVQTRRCVLIKFWRKHPHV